MLNLGGEKDRGPIEDTPGRRGRGKGGRERRKLCRGFPDGAGKSRGWKGLMWYSLDTSSEKRGHKRSGGLSSSRKNGRKGLESYKSVLNGVPRGRPKGGKERLDGRSPTYLGQEKKEEKHPESTRASPSSETSAVNGD